MFDKNDPEIQEYLQEELQKRTEQIAERIFRKHVHDIYPSLTYGDMEYCTGLKRDKLKELAEKSLHKQIYQEGYMEGSVLGMVGSYCRFLEENGKEILDNLDKEKSSEDNADIQSLKRWVEDPLKCAVLELVSHNCSNESIIKELQLTEEQFHKLYPSSKERWKYHKMFTPDQLSEEKLEEAYQKHFGKTNCNNSDKE